MNLYDGDVEHLDDVARAALTLLTHDRPRPVKPLIKYVAEHTHPAPDPSALQRIRRRHRH